MRRGHRQKLHIPPILKHQQAVAGFDERFVEEPCRITAGCLEGPANSELFEREAIGANAAQQAVDFDGIHARPVAICRVNRNFVVLHHLYDCVARVDEELHDLLRDRALLVLRLAFLHALDHHGADSAEQRLGVHCRRWPSR